MTACDRGGNTASDSMTVTVYNDLSARGVAVPCDADPDSSGIIVSAPGIAGAPRDTTDSGGGFALSLGLYGDIVLRFERTGYHVLDTMVPIPGGPLRVALRPDYLLGDCNHDGAPDAVDIGIAVDVIFFSADGWPIPYWSGDMDFSRAIDAVDLGLLIDLVFFGASSPGAPRCIP